MSQNNYIYLDNNATTPIDPEVLNCMMPYLQEYYGNPNSSHMVAQQTHLGLENAANQLYHALNIPENDTLIMTSSATESINSVHKHILFDFLKNNNNNNKDKNQIITSLSEHVAVRKSLAHLQEFGIEIISINTDSTECLKNFKEVYDPEKTLLVSIGLAHSETGIIRPIKEITALCSQFNTLIHTDATQAIGKIPIDVQDLNVDYLSFSGHKFYAPKGVGGLFVKHSASFTPLLHGGHQMGGFRSGTLNVAGIIGMGKAIEIATQNLAHYIQHVSLLKNHLETFLTSIPDCTIYGKDLPRLPNTTFFNIKHLDHDFIVWHLNKNNIAVSTGSACSTKNINNTKNNIPIETGIRISLSKHNTQDEIDTVITIIKNMIKS